MSNPDKKYKSVFSVACADISAYLKKEYEYCEKRTAYTREDIDVWIISPRMMYNKETKRLNRELGINILNYQGNNNRSLIK